MAWEREPASTPSVLPGRSNSVCVSPSSGRASGCLRLEPIDPTWKQVLLGALRRLFSCQWRFEAVWRVFRCSDTLRLWGYAHKLRVALEERLKARGLEVKAVELVSTADNSNATKDQIRKTLDSIAK